MHILFHETNDQEELLVYDTEELYGERGRFRVLEFANEAIQGAVDLNKTDRILFEYPQAILHLLEHNIPGFQDVFMIGHGTGTIGAHLQDKRVKTVEWDSRIIELSRRFFGCRQEAVVAGDGRRVLEEEPDESYDFLIIDAFTAKGTPAHLTSMEFFSTARRKLRGNGAVILNLIGRGERDIRVSAVHTTLSRHFPYTRSFQLPQADSKAIRNILVVGSPTPVHVQSKHMAGFTPLEVEEGHVIWD